jgi:hypothetical protein
MQNKPEILVNIGGSLGGLLLGEGILLQVASIKCRKHASA